MSEILLTIQDAKTLQYRFIQLKGKPAAGVIDQIKRYGIDHIYDGLEIPGLGIVVHKVKGV